MPRDKNQLKEFLKLQSKKQLEEILVKLSAKRYNYEFLLINFIDPESGEQQLFEETLEDLSVLRKKTYPGRTSRHQRVKMLNACLKRVNEFTIEGKNKKLEADLILNILQHEFKGKSLFGARTSGYDYKVALILKRMITLVTKKIHPDYRVDYADQINDFLQRIHTSSSRINTVKALPMAIDD